MYEILEEEVLKPATDSGGFCISGRFIQNNEIIHFTGQGRQDIIIVRAE